MSGLVRTYLRLLERYPWRTQALSTGILMGAGDVIAQFAIEGATVQTYVPQRTSRFLMFGTFFAGPVLRGWYLTLDRFIKFPAVKGALAKVAADQLLFAPTFCAVMLGTIGYWRTGTVEAATNMLSESYVDVIVSNYKLWPAAQIINFYFIPLQHRVLYVNSLALVWNTYIAWRSEKSHQRSQLSSPSH